MEANEETYNLFDNYLSGNLSGEEKALFEKRLSEDESFKEEFTWMSSAANSIRMSGKQILKKQIAEIGSGIPATAFEKYSPSIKPKNFFRKYWWAVTIASALIIAVACWVVLKHNKSAEQGELDVAPVADSTKNKDSAGKQMNQSTLDSLINAQEKDSANAGAAQKVGGQPSTQGCPIGDNCRSFEMTIFPQSGDDLQWSASVDSANGRHGIREAQNYVSIASNGDQKITVTLCPQTAQAPYYSFVGDIVICAAYTDSTKIRFHENDKGAIIMTDGKPGYFTLTQGAGVKNLVREFDSKGKKPMKPADKTKIENKKATNQRGVGEQRFPGTTIPTIYYDKDSTGSFIITKAPSGSYK